MSVPSMDVMIMGHTDAGKTSTTGQFICKFGGISDEMLTALGNKIEQLRLGSYKFVWLCEKLMSERLQGSGADVSIWNYSSDRSSGMILDVIGEKNCTQEMVTKYQGCSVLLCVSAQGQEYEDNIGQIHEQVCTVLSLGVPLVIGINKIDVTDPPHSEARFEEIKRKLLDFFRKCHLDSNAVPVVPYSAVDGDNLLKTSTRLPWFTGWIAKKDDREFKGMTLFDALLQQDLPEKDNDEQEGDTKDETQPPESKRTKLYKIDEYGLKIRSFLDNALSNFDLVLDSRQCFEGGILVSGAKGVGNKLNNFLMENVEKKVFHCFAMNLLEKELEDIISQAESVAPAVVVMLGLEKLDNKLIQILKGKFPMRKYVLVVCTTSRLADVDKGLLSLFQTVELED